MEIQTLPYRWGIEKVSKNANAAFFMQSNWRTLSLSLAEGKERERKASKKNQNVRYLLIQSTYLHQTLIITAQGEKKEGGRERERARVYIARRNKTRERARNG